MPRTKSKAPTLEQRCPPNGEWTFRRLINGKRKTFYTGTSNYQEATFPKWWTASKSRA